MRVIRGLFLCIVIVAALWVLIPHGNPGGISDAKYSRFERLAPPKVLYSCTRKPTRESLVGRVRACIDTGRAGCEQELDQWVEAGTETVVDFEAGSTTSTYDEVLQQAKRNCKSNVGNMGPGEFEVLEADEG